MVFALEAWKQSEAKMHGKLQSMVRWERMWHTGLTAGRESEPKVWQLVEIEGRGWGNRFICNWCKRITTGIWKIVRVKRVERYMYTRNIYRTREPRTR